MTDAQLLAIVVEHLGGARCYDDARRAGLVLEECGIEYSGDDLRPSRRDYDCRTLADAVVTLATTVQRMRDAVASDARDVLALTLAEAVDL